MVSLLLLCQSVNPTCHEIDSRELLLAPFFLIRHTQMNVSCTLTFNVILLVIRRLRCKLNHLKLANIFCYLNWHCFVVSLHIDTYNDGPAINIMLTIVSNYRLRNLCTATTIKIMIFSVTFLKFFANLNDSPYYRKENAVTDQQFRHHLFVLTNNQLYCCPTIHSFSLKK